MNMWDNERIALREKDSFVPIRRLYKVIKADLTDAVPGDFEKSSVRWIPLSFFIAMRCLFTLYSTAVIVVSAFRYTGLNWLSWLPFTAQVATGLYFMMAGILSQVHYLILVCIKGNLCGLDKNSNMTTTSELPANTTHCQSNGTTYTVVRETTFKNGDSRRKSATSSLLNESPVENPETFTGKLSKFHHLFWVVSDIVPALNLVLFLLVLVEDPSLFSVNEKQGINSWYVSLNVYLLSAIMLLGDFLIGRIPKRTTHVIFPCLFSLVFWTFLKITARHSSVTPQWLPPFRCSTIRCAERQELYIMVGTPLAHCLFCLLYHIKKVVITYMERGRALPGEWV